MVDKIDYDVVSEIAGHQENRGVDIISAVNDIFAKVRNKAMQVAVKGEFISFDSVEDLQGKLSSAADNGYSIRVFDENIGG